jgi:hypothetical protein
MSVPARAGDKPAVEPGSEVRVTEQGDESGRTLTGTVRALRSGGILIDVQAEYGDQAPKARTLPRDAIARLEVRTPPEDRLHRVLTGTAVGVLLGVGAAAVAASLNDGTALCDTTTATSCELGIGAVLGGASGLAIGALSSGERWNEIDLPPSAEEPDTAAGPPAPAVSRR